jgi:outer membrane cobalamin receptor
VWNDLAGTLLSLVLALQGAGGQAPELQSDGRLFKVVVTAPPVIENTSVDRYGNRTSVVSADQLSDLNAWDLASALRRVPGVVHSRYNLVGSYGGADGGAVYIRGHGSGRPGAEILTMVDGIPRFVGVWTHPLLDMSGLSTVDEIEISKSPQPVKFGNMSFGAINLKRHVPGKAGFHGRLETAYGEHGTYFQRVGFHGGAGKARFSAAGTYRESSGHRRAAGGQVLDLSGLLTVDLKDRWAADLQFAHAGGWADDPGSTDAPPLPVTERFRSKSDFFVVALRHSYPRFEGTTRVYVEDGGINWGQWDRSLRVPFATITDYRNYGVRLQEKLQIWERSEVILGVDHDSYGGQAVEHRPASTVVQTVDQRFRNSAPYFMFSRSFGRATVLTPSFGLRLNQARYFGTEWGGQAGVTLQSGVTGFYMNWSRGFNYPGVYAASLYSQWGRGDQWQRLRPEHIEHFEVGTEWQAGPRTKFDLSLFHDRVSDAIRLVPPPPPPPMLANVGAYRSRGIEASLSWFPTEKLALFSAATYQDTLSGMAGGVVPNAPRWTWISGFTCVPGARWRLSMDAQWLDRHFVLNPRFALGEVGAQVDSYLLLNGRGSRFWRLAPRNILELYVAVENASDGSYELRPGYPMPGRTWMSGLSWSF